jgi:hypothetical protein
MRLSKERAKEDRMRRTKIERIERLWFFATVLALTLVLLGVQAVNK